MRIIAIAALAIFASFWAPVTRAADTSSPSCDIDCRVKALEKKTNFYRKKTAEMQVTYQGGKKRAPDANCVNGILQLTTDDTIIIPGGAAYTWAKATADVSGDVGSVQVIIQLQRGGNVLPENTCDSITNVVNQTLPFQDFCTFDVEQGDKLVATFYASSGSSCDELSNLDLQYTLTQLEIDPPN